jgi:hypothetical protein
VVPKDSNSAGLDVIEQLLLEIETITGLHGLLSSMPGPNARQVIDKTVLLACKLPALLPMSDRPATIHGGGIDI